jgi:serine/threonine-protein kinase
MSAPEPRCYAFGDFRIDAVARRLSRRDGTPVMLTARVFDTLLHLVRHAGTSLGKDELLAAIWPGRVVEENNLTQSISTLRKVLGAETDGQRYIVTEPGRGYRFVADVQVAFDEIVGVDAQLRGALQPVGRSTRALAGLLLIAVVAAGFWLVRQQGPHIVAPPITTIAVLPFKPLVAGDRDEVLELGMADTLIAKLSSSRRLVVRSLGSVRKFSALEQDPLAAGRELDVGSVLEGQVQHRADHVHVTARLLSVPGGAALWTGTFDENLTDVFALQDTIAQKVAAALSLQFDRDEQRLMRAGYTRNSDAYMLYLQGRYRIAKTTPTDIHAGLDAFHKAIDLDPTFALAYAGMAEGYSRLPITADVAPRETFPLAKAAAAKALEIDEGIAEAHSVLGWVAFWYDWDWVNAEKEFRRAIELNPNLAEAHLGYGHMFWLQGHSRQANAEGRRARELDPLSPRINLLSAAFGPGEEYPRLMAKVAALDPDFWVLHMLRGNIAAREQRYADAFDEFAKAKQFGGSQRVTTGLVTALIHAGRMAEAQAILADLESRAQHEYIPGTSIATIYAELGDTEHAIAWLQRACEERDVELAFIRVRPFWKALRGDPRFAAIEAQIKFE